MNHDHHHHDGHVHGPLAFDMIDWGLVIGLVLHKVPVAMVLMAMMQEQHVPRPCGLVGLGGVWVVSTCGHAGL